MRPTLILLLLLLPLTTLHEDVDINYPKDFRELIARLEQTKGTVPILFGTTFAT